MGPEAFMGQTAISTPQKLVIQICSRGGSDESEAVVACSTLSSHLHVSCPALNFPCHRRYGSRGAEMLWASTDCGHVVVGLDFPKA